MNKFILGALLIAALAVMVQSEEAGDDVQAAVEEVGENWKGNLKKWGKASKKVGGDTSKKGGDSENDGGDTSKKAEDSNDDGGDSSKKEDIGSDFRIVKEAEDSKDADAEDSNDDDAEDSNDDDDANRSDVKNTLEAFRDKMKNMKNDDSKVKDDDNKVKPTYKKGEGLAAKRLAAKRVVDAAKKEQERRKEQEERRKRWRKAEQERKRKEAEKKAEALKAEALKAEAVKKCGSYRTKVQKSHCWWIYNQGCKDSMQIKWKKNKCMKNALSLKSCFIIKNKCKPGPPGRACRAKSNCRNSWKKDWDQWTKIRRVADKMGARRSRR